MKSVLDVAGYFLYLGYMVIIMPIVSVLYLLLALVLGCQYLNSLVQQVPKLFGKAAAAAGQVARQRWIPSKKWHLGWHLNKAS